MFSCAGVVVRIRDWPSRPSVVTRQVRGAWSSSEKHCPKDAAELDAVERREWLDSLDYVLQSGGPVKVQRLLAI